MIVRRRSVLLGAAGLGAVLLGGCGAGPTGPAPSPAPPAGPAADPAAAFTAAAADLEAAFGRRIGVHALDTGTGVSVGNRADERFLMCSTMKAPLAAAVLHRSLTDPGLLDRLITWTADDLLDHAPVTEANLGSGLTVAQLCEATVTTSDNTAANLLLDQLGGPGGVAAFTRGLGDDVSSFDRAEPDLNVSAGPDDTRDTTTPAAFAAQLRALVLGDALPAAQRDVLTGWLVGNTTGDEQIRAGVPQGWRVGDKTGSGFEGQRNDVGVLWPPDGAPIVVTVFTAPVGTDDDRGRQAIAETTRAALTALGLT